MVLQIPKLNVNGNVKLVVFVAWAAYGVLPTLHWSVVMGGLDNPIVRMLLPRVLGMYIISGVAFAIYLSKIPERFCPGNCEYCSLFFLMICKCKNGKNLIFKLNAQCNCCIIRMQFYFF